MSHELWSTQKKTEEKQFTPKAQISGVMGNETGDLSETTGI
jgi:hypothetical protein